MALRHLRSEIADQTSVANLVFPILSRPGPSLSSLRNALSNFLGSIRMLEVLDGSANDLDCLVGF